MTQQWEYSVGMRDGNYIVLRDGLATTGRFSTMRKARDEIDRLCAIDAERQRVFGERMADLLTLNLAYSAAEVREFDDWETAWGWFHDQPQDVKDRIYNAAQRLKANAAVANGVSENNRA
ncbi:hypothetical protein [Cupriavidus sp. L7L]|uniref:hypothetical protein n=1 Tax=Cupriavidus sp. L7L TaxID=2546443 RepID=UPI0010548253|nr:hypothetical protein [Cupriavidus sp. L7L]TDF60131.1 hypothetical protein E1J61_33980 [Cupriavidus sp. L7L]